MLLLSALCNEWSSLERVVPSTSISNGSERDIADMLSGRRALNSRYTASMVDCVQLHTMRTVSQLTR